MGTEFLSRKITYTLSKIKAGLENYLYLGNLEAKRDWGYAPEYVEAMWLMLQQDKPDDYVIATGETHSVKEFVKKAFDYVRLDWKKYVKIDPNFFSTGRNKYINWRRLKGKKNFKMGPKNKIQPVGRIDGRR